MIEVRIEKLFTEEKTKLKAIVGLRIKTDIGDFAVHGIRIFENYNGFFVQMPMIYNKSNGNPQPLEVFHAVSAEARQALCEAILQEYEKALEKSKS